MFQKISSIVSIVFLLSAVSAIPRPDSPFDTKDVNLDGGESDVVNEFTDYFVSGIYSDPDLVKPFDLGDAKQEDFVNLFGTTVFNIHKPVDLKAAKISTRILSRAVDKNFNDLTTYKIIKTYGDAMGDTLQVLDVLLPDNVLKLAQGFVYTMADSIYSIKDDKPETAVNATISGYAGFLQKLHLFTKENIYITSAIFSSKLYTL